jgi:hypothetical protein
VRLSSTHPAVTAARFLAVATPIPSHGRPAGPALHAAVHQDGRLPGELRLLLAVEPLEQGHRDQGGEADEPGGGV